MSAMLLWGYRGVRECVAAGARAKAARQANPGGLAGSAAVGTEVMAGRGSVGGRGSNGDRRARCSCNCVRREAMGRRPEGVVVESAADADGGRSEVRRRTLG